MTTPDDLLKLAPPVTSVVIVAPSAHHDAADQLDLRWRNARAELEGLGVEAEVLEDLSRTFDGLEHSGGDAVACFRDADGTTVVEFIDRAPEREVLVAHDQLARLSWLLEPQQRVLPHLLVVTDRVGAELTSCTSAGESGHEEVRGDALHVHRSHPGGWSQRRFQQRAENRWEDNAGEVAEAVVRVAGEIDASVVVVAGDVRATGLLTDALPADVAERTTVVEEGSPEGIEDAVDTAVATAVATRTAEVLAQFREALGVGTAANGEAETLLALTEGRVDTLLIHDDPDDDRRARYDPDSAWASLAGDSTAVVPVDDPPVGRLVDVAIRAALLSGAEVRFVPAHGGPDAHLGALLRW